MVSAIPHYLLWEFTAGDFPRCSTTIPQSFPQCTNTPLTQARSLLHRLPAKCKQDYRALLTAKYCPRAAAASCTQKNTQKPTWPWPLILKFSRLLEVVEVHVRAQFHQAKCSGSWVINSALDIGQLWTSDREHLWNWSSNRQVENGVSNYDFFHVPWKQLGEHWSTYEKM